MKIKQILEGLTDEQVDQFHTELDDLVHKHLGHSSDEEESEDLEEAVAGPDKCWPGYAPGAQSGVKTKAGTGKNKGKRVNNCEPITKKK